MRALSAALLISTLFGATLGGCDCGSAPASGDDPDHPKPPGVTTPQGNALLPDPARTTVEVMPASGIPADGITAAEVRVTARNSAGAPLRDLPVSIEAAGLSVSLTQPPPTGADGSTTGSLTSTTAGTATLTVILGTGADALILDERPTVSFVPVVAPTFHLSFRTSPDEATAGATFVVEVELRDDDDNLAAGDTREVSVSLTSGPASLGGTTVAALSGGVARFEGLHVDQAGSGYVLRATAADVGAIESAPFDVAPGPIDPLRSSLVITPAELVADGTAAATVEAELQDAFGNAVSNATVAVEVSGSGNLLEPSSGETDAQGGFTAALRSTVAEGKTVVLSAVRAGSSESVGTAEVHFIAGPTTSLALDLEPASVVADGVAASVIRVTTRDAHANPTEGISVDLSAAGPPGLQLSTTTVVTDADGEATAQVHGDHPGEATLTATVGALEASGTLTLLPSPVRVTPEAVAGAGCVSVPYSLRHPLSARADLRVEYERDGVFHRATQAGSSTTAGVRSLSSSPTGTPYTFLWNSSADLPFLNTVVNLRLMASTEGAEDDVVTVSGVRVDNGLQLETTTAHSLGGHIPTQLLLDDLDGDGGLDLIAPSPSTGAVAVVRGAPTGLQGQPPIATGHAPSSVLTEDFDRDGDRDLVTADETSQVLRFRLASAPQTFDSPAIEVSLAAAPRSLLGGDFNRDGVPDVAALTAAGTVEVITRDPSSAFVSVATTDLGTAPAAALTADLDGDGKLDLVIAHGSGISSWSGDGSGGFHASDSVAIAGGASTLAAADFDRDGWLDIAAAHASSALLSIARGSTAGLEAAVALPVSGPVAAIATADADASGTIDIALATDLSVEVLLNDGSGAFTVGHAASLAAATSLVFLDRDRNGRPELIASADGQTLLSIFQNTTPQRCEPGLGAAQVFLAGDEPTSLVVEDFDQDGKPDVAVANAGVPGGTIGIFRGLGNASFATMDSFLVGTGPKMIRSGDFDEDGWIDLVTANETDGTVSVALSNQGGFSGATSFPAGAGAASLAVGRFDDDVHLDLLVVNRAAKTVALLAGDGAGGFAEPIVLHTFSVAPKHVAAADIEGDGDLDFAVTSGQAHFFQNHGGGSFSLERAVTVASNPDGLAFGDLDGDGAQDLVTSSSQFAVSVTRRTGPATFTSTQVTVGSPNSSVTIEDLDGDGDGDLAVVGPVVGGGLSSTVIRIVLNDGSGGFGAPQVFEAGRGLTEVTGGDFDGDGSIDLAGANAQIDALSVIRGRGDGTLAAAHPVSVASNGNAVTTDSGRLADLNRDGAPDLVTEVAGYRSIAVLLGLPSGGFGPAVLYDAGGFVSDLMLTDFDEDGLVDAAVAIGSSVRILHGIGDGSFAPPPATDAVAVQTIHALEAADFDRDGHMDLLLSATSSKVHVYLGQGDGTFPTLWNVGVDNLAFDVAPGDLDRDGWPDVIAVAKGSDHVAFYRNPRVAGAAFIKTTVSTGTGTGPEFVTVADIDLDGWLDAVTVNTGTSKGTSWIRGNGGGAMTFGGEVTVEGAPRMPAIADVDGDGRAEILVPTDSERTVAVVRTTGGSARWSVGLSARAVAVGDVDRDGLIDVVATGTGTTGQVFVLYGR